VTIHESRAGDTVPLVATSAAKAAGARPFKRPENMAWLPDSKFRTFFFTTTGDTDAPTSGSLFRVDLREENFGKGGSKIKPLDDGMTSIFVLGDQLHNSFDNLAFANEHQVSVADDRGDTQHQQLNVLDSVWAFDVDRRQPLASAVRFIALGRDALAAPEGEEDNEPTGLFVANGSTRKSLDDARGFFTMQHGQNSVFEILRKDVIKK
jgi:secreted PhoX family phosphatase